MIWTMHISIFIRHVAKLPLLAIPLSLMALQCNAATLTVHVLDENNQPVDYAVVTVRTVNPAHMPKLKPQDESIDQVNREFVPMVKPITVGSMVSFPNKDNIRHQVYSFSPAKKFELSLYKGTTAPPVLFDKPGPVVLGCNIHDWMVGYVYVSDTPLYAMTSSDGAAVIPNVPDEAVRIRVWSPDSEQKEEDTETSADPATATPTSLTIHLRTHPPLHIRRESSAGGSHYP